MTRRKPFLISLVVLLCLGVAAVLFIFGGPPGWVVSRELSAALREARSVTLVEFVPYSVDAETGKVSDGEVVFQRLTATQKQIEALKSATPGLLTFLQMKGSMKGCFTPHHRVEIIRSDGALAEFILCFKCENFRFDGGYTEPIPAAWMQPLTRLFSDAGMPPRTEEEYHELAERLTKN